MKLKHQNAPIDLFPYIDSTFACCGEVQAFPSDLNFTVVKKKKNITLIRCKRAGFTWVNNNDLTK